MKSQIRCFIVLCLVVNFIFISVTSAHACTPDIRSNYWYKLDYSIANDSLPSAVDVVGNHPPYDPYNPDGSYEDWLGRESVLGQLEFTNESDELAYIVPDDVVYNVDQYRESSRQYAQAVVTLADELARNDDQIDLGTFSDTFSDHIVKSNSSLIHRTYKGMEALMYNPQVPGRVESLPPPFLYESVLIQENQRYTIPITITYNLNSQYNSNFTAFNAPLRDYLINTDAVVLGQVIGAAEDAEPTGRFPDSEGNAQIVGYARIQVEEWVLGDGPTEIEVGSFSNSPGADCGIGIWMSNRAYFLLKTPADTDSIRYPLTRRSGRTLLRANDGNVERLKERIETELQTIAEFQALAEPAATVPTALSITDEPGISIFLPYISR